MSDGLTFLQPPGSELKKRPGCRKRGAQVHADEKAQESQVRTEDLEQALPQLASGDMPPAQSGTFDCVNTSPVGTPVPTA